MVLLKRDDANNMVELAILTRPSVPVIKLVESIGILLGIPLSTEKSKFKAPMPSNYDETVETLRTDFYGSLNYITNLKSADINNYTASDFYNKVLEPGFDYEEAFITGGLICRELFNAMFNVLVRLKTDENRIPIKEHAVYVLVDGSRASYIALDTAVHIYNHGKLNIVLYEKKSLSAQEGGFDVDNMAISSPDSRASSNSLSSQALSLANATSTELQTHLYSDVVRRCKHHFKLKEHNYNVIPLTSFIDAEGTLDGNGDSRNSRHSDLKNLIDNNKDEIIDAFVVGISDRDLGSSAASKSDTDTLSLALWAVWECKRDVILCQGMGLVRAFDTVSFPRKVMLFVNSKANAKLNFLKALKFIRPGDSISIICLVNSRQPSGDNTGNLSEMSTDALCRFGFGKGRKSGWVNEANMEDAKNDVLGYNDSQLEDLSVGLYNMIELAHMTGDVYLHEISPFDAAQLIYKEVAKLAPSMVLMEMKDNKEIIVECVKNLTCSLALLR